MTNSLSFKSAWRLCEALPVAQNHPDWSTYWDEDNMSEYLEEVCGEPVSVDPRPEIRCPSCGRVVPSFFHHVDRPCTEDVEVFYMAQADMAELKPEENPFTDRDGQLLGSGWFWWQLVEGEPDQGTLQGPFETEELAQSDSQGQ